MGEKVGRTPLDLLSHLVSRAGETERQIGHASINVGLYFLQTLGWSTQGTVAVNQRLKRLVVAPREVGDGHLFGGGIVSGHGGKEEHAALNVSRVTTVGRS